jgi:hypothetical protein
METRREASSLKTKTALTCITLQSCYTQRSDAAHTLF